MISAIVYGYHAYDRLTLALINYAFYELSISNILGLKPLHSYCMFNIIYFL